MSMPKGKFTTARKPKGQRAGTTVPLSSIVGFSSGEPSLLPREPLDMEDFTIDAEGKLFYAARVTDGSGDVSNTLLNVYEFPPLASGASPRPHTTGLQVQKYGQILKQPRKEFHISQNDFPPLPNAPTEPSNQPAAADGNSHNLSPAASNKRAAVAQNLIRESAELPAAASADVDDVTDLIGACGLYDSSSIVSLSDDAHTNDYTADESATATESCDWQSATDQPSKSEYGNVLPPNDYGMLGLVPMLERSAAAAGQTMLTIGFNFEELGIDFSSSTPLYERLVSPLSERPLAPHATDSLIPEEYKVSAALHEKLQPVNLESNPEDTIFFIFYNITNDLLQVQAAEQLYMRGWRFHKEMRIWISRVHDAKYERFGRFVSGQFIIFDHISWKKVYKQMEINLDKFEGRQNPSDYKVDIMPNNQYNFNENGLNGVKGPVPRIPLRPPPGFSIHDYDYCKELDDMLRDQRLARQRATAASANAPSTSRKMSTSRNAQ